MKPYTYLIKHIPTNRVYYGVRYQNVKKKIAIRDDLGTKYFTSCNKIKELIESDGWDSFEFEIRKTFDTPADAVAWETKVLTRMNVLRDDKWFNQNINGKIVLNAESCNKISTIRLNKSPVEKALIYNMMLTTTSNRTDDEKAKTTQLRKQSATQLHARRTLTEKQKINQKQSTAYHSKTLAERSIINEKLVNSRKKLKWYNNGITTKKLIPGTEPVGFVLGRKLYDVN